jgi:hypothetical protein
MPTLNIELNPDISNLEKKIVLEEEHFNRGDVSDYVLFIGSISVTYNNIIN